MLKMTHSAAMNQDSGAHGSQAEFLNQPELCFESKQHRRQAENGTSHCEMMNPQTI